MRNERQRLAFKGAKTSRDKSVQSNAKLIKFILCTNRLKYITYHHIIPHLAVNLICGFAYQNETRRASYKVAVILSSPLKFTMHVGVHRYKQDARSK